MSKLLRILDNFSVFDWAPTPLLAIVWRELLTALRQFRFGLLLLLMGSVVLLRTLFTLAQLHARMVYPSTAIHEALTLQCNALLLIVCLVVPALGAVTLAAERQQKTEDLLHTALFHPATLTLGKLLAVLAIFSLIHVALLPFGAFIYFFAGIEVRSLFQIAFLLYSTAFFHAVIGMAASRASQSVNRALFLAFALVILLYAVPIALHQRALAVSTAAIAPPPPLNPVTLVPALVASTADWADCLGLAWQQGVGTLLALGLLVVAAQGARVAARMKSDRGSHAVARRTTYRPIPDWGTPVFHKDRRAARLGHPGWALLAFAVSGAAAWVFNLWSIQELQWSVTAIDACVGVVYLLIPFMVIERCAREMNPETLVHLRMSLVGSERVLHDKALAVLCHLAPMLLGTIAGTALPMLLGNYDTFTADLRDPPSVAQLVYQSVMLGPKALIAIGICLMCTRFRAPGAADLAVNLALSALLLGLTESLSQGLFESATNGELNATQILIVLLGHLLAMGCAFSIIFGIAQMRFGFVFDEGSDLYALSHVERRNF